MANEKARKLLHAIFGMEGYRRFTNSSNVSFRFDPTDNEFSLRYTYIENAELDQEIVYIALSFRGSTEELLAYFGLNPKGTEELLTPDILWNAYMSGKMVLGCIVGDIYYHYRVIPGRMLVTVEIDYVSLDNVTFPLLKFPDANCYLACSERIHEKGGDPKAVRDVLKEMGVDVGFKKVIKRVLPFLFR